MDKQQFISDFRDMVADNAEECGELHISPNTISYDPEIGYWTAAVVDGNGITYTAVDYDGDMRIMY